MNFLVMSTHCYSLLCLKLLTYLETGIVSVMVKLTHSPGGIVSMPCWASGETHVVSSVHYPLKEPGKKDTPSGEEAEGEDIQRCGGKKELFRSHSWMCCWRWSPSVYLPSLEVAWRTSELLRLTLAHLTNTCQDHKCTMLHSKREGPLI